MSFFNPELPPTHPAWSIGPDKRADKIIKAQAKRIAELEAVLLVVERHDRGINVNGTYRGFTDIDGCGHNWREVIEAVRKALNRSSDVSKK